MTETEKAGRPVTVGEVAAYAKKNCAFCSKSPAGPGVVVVAPPAGKAQFAERQDDGSIVQGTRKVPSPRHVQACGCAVRRFLKANASLVESDPKGGNTLRWKPLEFTTAAA